MAVADTFGAMTSDRPYRKGLPLDTATAEIARCASTQFAPDVAAAFLRAVRAGAVVPVAATPALAAAA